MPVVTNDIAPVDDEASIPTKSVEILGEKFKVLKTFNAFNFARVFDDDPITQMNGITTYLINAIAGADKVRFKNLLARQASLTADTLVGILNTVQEAQAEPVPTKRPAASRRTTTKKGASRPSVVRSSARG